MTEPTPTGPKYRVEMWDDNGKKIVDFEEQGRWDGSVAPPVTLAEFLRARLDEDEAAARRCDRGAWATVDWNSMPAEQHGTRHDPARVLAEVEAKRRIVENISGYLRSHISDDFSGEHLGEDVLALLALPYAGHSDYRSEWAP